MADTVISAGTSSATIQTTINNAARGDTITFEAGATFDTAGWSLPVKSGTNDGTDANSVILRSSLLANLTSGTRVSPSQNSNMPRLRATDSTSVFTAASGAGGYKFLGLEISNVKASPGASFVVNLMVDLASAGAHFTIDRCFFHPQEYPNNTPPYNTTGRFAIALNGANFKITNSYFGGFYGLYYGTTTGATPIDGVGLSVGAVNTLLYDNNYVECWYNPIFLGGSDTNPTSSATISSATLTSATLSNTTGLSVGDIIAISLPVDSISTTLSSALNNSDTTINVVSTTGWNSSGRAVIDRGLGAQEHISYTGKTSNTLTGVTRGTNGQSPLSHSSGASIIETYCKRGVGQTCWGNGVVQSISGNDITYTALVGTDYQGFFAIPIPSSVVPSGTAQWMGDKIQNVTISRNHLHIPTTFAQWVRTNNGNHPKAYAEIKSLENSTIEGNFCDGYFSTWAFNTVNQSGGSPWLRLYNVTIRNNWTKGTRSLCFLVFDEQYYLCTDGGNVTITNNLATDPDSNAEAGDMPAFISAGNGGTGIVITHNTVYMGDSYTQNSINWDKLSAPHSTSPSTVTFKDNIIYQGNYGFQCGSGGGMLGCWSVTEDQNLFVLNVNPPNQHPITDQGFTNSLTAANTAAVKFVNAGGATPSDYALASDSPGKNLASDTGDIGVNTSTLFAALSPTDQAEIGGGEPPAPPPPSPSIKLIAICT